MPEYRCKGNACVQKKKKQRSNGLGIVKGREAKETCQAKVSLCGSRTQRERRSGAAHSQSFQSDANDSVKRKGRQRGEARHAGSCPKFDESRMRSLAVEAGAG